MKGMMEGWHGDEYEVEFTQEEWQTIKELEADDENDRAFTDNSSLDIYLDDIL